MEKENTTHHGKFLRNIWKRSRLSLDILSERSGYSKTSIYRWMNQENLEAIKILNISRACGFDIRGLIPQVDDEMERLEKTMSAISVQDTKLYKDKYLEALEELREVQSELKALQLKYSQLNRDFDSLKTPGQELDKSKRKASAEKK